MAINVHAYFDESGDPGTRAASSDHLILGGFLVSVSDEAAVLHQMAAARTELGFAPNKVFHFSKLPHDKRLRWAEIVGSMPITAVVIALCKRGGSIKSPIQADALYNWLARLAMERCSWWCEGNGTLTSLTFEHPKGYQSWKMGSYVVKLKTLDTQIKWSHLHTPVRFGHKSTHELLQVADCIASATGHAFQPQYGFIEPKYLQLIAPRLWRRYGQLIPYGVKVHPPQKRAACETDHSWVATL